MAKEDGDMNYIPVKASELVFGCFPEDLYIPLFVSSMDGDGYYYIDKNTKLTPKALKEAYDEWEKESSGSFYDFIHKEGKDKNE